MMLNYKKIYKIKQNNKKLTIITKIFRNNFKKIKN